MRKDITGKQNVWLNGQQVDNDDLSTEQNYVNTISSGLTYNHIGQGILPDSLVKNLLFDSSLIVGDLDGTPLSIQTQPSDSDYGNQLELNLSDSDAFGLRTVKVVLFGLDFNNTLFYETFTFHKNESQYSKNHFKQVVSILINDMFAITLSMNLGGVLKIYEAPPATLSRDCLTLSQNIQPSLFWRDFFSTTTSTVIQLIESALPTYDVSSLQIFTEEFNVRELAKNDITTEIGQKFKSNSDNIQKIRLLLSVENNDPGDELDLEWEGDLVFTVYPLQSTISCPTDLAPNLEIEFDPIPTPLAQVTFNYTSLLDKGFELSNVAQPIDIILSNTSLANKKIEKDKFYALTIKRSGTASKCDIKIYLGQDLTEDSRVTIFNGNYWTDIQSEDLWFEIYSDSAKITSAKIYENGFGIEIPKVKEIDEVNQSYLLNELSFNGNDTFTAIVTSQTELTDPVENKRTGTVTQSKQQKVPSVELLSTIETSNLDSFNNSLKLGVISDKNKKFESPTTYSLPLKAWTIIGNNIIVPLLEDNTDPRKDGYTNDILSAFLNGELIGSKFTPDLAEPTKFYRVGSAEKLTMTYGDWDGDCIIDADDYSELSKYLDFDLNVSPPLLTNIVTDSVTTTCTNGYEFLTNKSQNASSITFEVIDSSGTILASDTDGILVSTSNTDSSFSSVAVDFSLIPTLTECKLVIYSVVESNKGLYDIVGLDTNTLTIRKKYLDLETLLSLLRCNVNGDFLIDGYDGYLIESYLTRDEITIFPTLTYPAPTSNAYDKIGTKFSVLKIQLESYVDRHDDYYSLDRSNLHELIDIFSLNTNLQSNDYSVTNINAFADPKLQWNEYFIITKSKLVYVPNAIIESSGYAEFSCDENCIEVISYPQELTFDPGIVNKYIPGNLIIGNGQILNSDKSYFKVDFEVGSVTIEVPDNFLGTEKTINIFSNFVYEQQDGKTISGFKAMKFADCTYVQSTALLNNQVRFDVSMQSFSPLIDGYEGSVEGVIVDPKMGVYLDPLTGLLRLNFTNIVKDDTKPTLSTKVNVTVFLKKAGFNNEPIIINPELTENLFI